MMSDKVMSDKVWNLYHYDDIPPNAEIKNSCLLVRISQDEFEQKKDRLHPCLRFCNMGLMVHEVPNIYYPKTEHLLLEIEQKYIPKRNLKIMPIINTVRNGTKTSGRR